MLEIDLGMIQKISECFSIIHHVPGRIRLRGTLKLKDAMKDPNAQDFISTIKKLPIVKNLKTNLIVGSVTIEYDSSCFAPSLWESWLKKERLDEILAIIQKYTKG